MIRALLETAIGLLGSQAKLADACGVTQASIWQAKEAGRVSAELALMIERATAGEVAARRLRPDLPWPDSPLAPDAHAQERVAS
jgi:DNA-binding transcriptional regulator YdaS (Cro superfamily)